MLVTGAYGRNDGATDAGEGYLFIRGYDGTWELATEVALGSPSSGDNFGNAVAVEGDTAVFGIKGHGGTDTGAIGVISVPAPVFTSTSVQYLHTDHLGSPVAATDDQGTVVDNHSYYPFSEIRSSSTVFDTERGFTGQIADAATGLNFYNARYYDTALGRFVSPDSIVPNAFTPSHFNRFVYVSNSPLIYTDPTGHCSYAGENDSCDYLEEGSNAGMGHLEEYAQVRIAAEDGRLETYEQILADYFAKRQQLIQHYEAVASGRQRDPSEKHIRRDTENGIKTAAKMAGAAIDNLMDSGNFEAFVGRQQRGLEGSDVGHPMDGPVDPSKWSIQPQESNSGNGGTSFIRKVTGSIAIAGGVIAFSQGVDEVGAGVGILVVTRGRGVRPAAMFIGSRSAKAAYGYELTIGGLCGGFEIACNAPGFPPNIIPDPY